MPLLLVLALLAFAVVIVSIAVMGARRFFLVALALCLLVIILGFVVAITWRVAEWWLSIIPPWT